jgi:hypothetical protein
VEWARGGTGSFAGWWEINSGNGRPFFILSFSFLPSFSLFSLSLFSLLIPFFRPSPCALDHVCHVNKREAGNEREKERERDTRTKTLATRKRERERERERERDNSGC